MTARAGGRGGFILVAMVLVLAGLLLLVHGSLLLAGLDREVSAVGVELLQAEGQARRAESRWRGGGLKIPAPGRLDLQEGEAGGRELLARRLTREWWWVEAHGWDPERRVQATRAAPVWVLDPVARVRGLGATVVLGEAAPREGSGWSGMDRPIRGEDAGCRGLEAALDSILPRGAPPVRFSRRLAIDGVRLGLLGADSLEARVPALADGRGTPEPVESWGACFEGPWNWGDPRRDSRGPCRDRWVARRAVGDLVVQGGTGQGLVVVGGDLVLTSGARLRGLVLVGGRLRLEAGARLEGGAVVRSGVSVDPTSDLRASACAVAQAVSHAPERLRVPMEGSVPWRISPDDRWGAPSGAGKE